VDYYRGDGIEPTVRRPGEILTSVRVPLPKTPRRALYSKWTVRGSIDFPLVSVALRFDLEQDSVDAAVTRLLIVVGVLGARPKVVGGMDPYVGRRLSSPDLLAGVTAAIERHCRPLENVPYEAAYRRRMIPVYARREMERMIAESRVANVLG
jgi:4-hydroxybenzoyl-CoA reductase subunit beta